MHSWLYNKVCATQNVMAKLKPYQLKAQKDWRDRQHRVLINFDKVKDASLLASLRSKILGDEEIPQLIKQILEEYFGEN